MPVAANVNGIKCQVVLTPWWGYNTILVSTGAMIGIGNCCEPAVFFVKRGKEGE